MMGLKNFLIRMKVRRIIRRYNEKIQILVLHDGDTLVLEHPSRLSDVAIRNITQSMCKLFPGVRTIVLEDGLRVRTILREKKI